MRTIVGEDDDTCADCGAVDCTGRFHACLAADFGDADYGRVHHLVVPAYGLQHGWYTATTEPGVVQFVLEHLDAPPSDHTRRRIRTATDGPVQVRARGPRGRPLDWEQHVGHVDRSSADRYVSTVREWARSVATTILDAPGARP